MVNGIRASGSVIFPASSIKVTVGWKDSRSFGVPALLTVDTTTEFGEDFVSQLVDASPKLSSLFRS